MNNHIRSWLTCKNNYTIQQHAKHAHLTFHSHKAVVEFITDSVPKPKTVPLRKALQSGIL